MLDFSASHVGFFGGILFVENLDRICFQLHPFWKTLNDIHLFDVVHFDNLEPWLINQPPSRNLPSEIKTWIVGLKPNGPYKPSTYHLYPGTLLSALVTATPLLTPRTFTWQSGQLFAESLEFFFGCPTLFSAEIRRSAVQGFSHCLEVFFSIPGGAEFHPSTVSTSWRLNQPIWKNESNWIISPEGVNIKIFETTT